MAGGTEREMMAHGDWKSSDSLQAYIGGRGGHGENGSRFEATHAGFDFAQPRRNGPDVQRSRR